MRYARTASGKSALAFTACALFAAHAAAAEGTTSAPVQMHAGPDTAYPDVMRLASGLKLEIHGCAAGWDWCDVSWRGSRGWVPAEALGLGDGETAAPPVHSLGAESGLPVVAFDLKAYWDAHYRERPWYADRETWPRPADRPDPAAKEGGP